MGKFSKLCSQVVVNFWKKISRLIIMQSSKFWQKNEDRVKSIFCQFLKFCKINFLGQILKFAKKKKKSSKVDFIATPGDFLK